MFKMELHWLVPAVLLGSDRLLNHEVNGAALNSLSQREYWSKLYPQALRDYQVYLPSRLRKEDIDLALSQWVDVEEPPELLGVLNRLREHFIPWYGDRFEVKHLELERWLTLLSHVDPVWIIGAGYAEWLERGVLGVEQVIELARNQCSSALPKRFDYEPVADNHVHLGGHGHCSLSLASFALHLKERPKQTYGKWPYRQEHNLMNSGMCDITLVPIMFHRLFGLLLQTMQGVHSSFPQSYNWDSLSTHLITPYAGQLRVKPPTDSAQRLLLAASNENSGTSCWLLMTTACLLWLRRPLSVYQTSLLRAFIQTASVLRNYMIVSGTGLSDFVDYFNFELRKPGTVFSYASHSTFNDLGPNHLREFRVSKNKAGYYAATAEEILKQQRDKHIHFVYHFTRTFGNNNSENRLYEITRGNNEKLVRELQSFLQSASHGDSPISISPFSSVKRVDLRAMLRGFDVAGNENEVPIEVFAPALRVLRSATHSSKSPSETRLRQPFITLHAGEDFSHILSGLRAVDEAVIFCDYQPGDRIGHGLALGIDALNWAKLQQNIYLPIQEHLDNLVWCYQKGIELIARCPQLQPTIFMIANKISLFCHYIHGKEFSPHVLYQAWLLRRNCPKQALKQGESLGIEWLQWVPDIDYIRQNQRKIAMGKIAEDAYQLWQSYLARPRHDYDRDRIVFLSVQGSTQPIIQSCAAGTLVDLLSPAELELIDAIQDLMLERFSQSQWIIEACPTSNLYIGRLERYEEHPLFRWFPPKREDLYPGGRANKFGIRKGPVRICINTDDAGLMPTTLENEHRVIKECAINIHGVSELDAGQWIDSIRRTGVELFNSNHLDWLKSV